jgi:TRAP-type C4-dicarboxylate transport system substrate-binding protein
MRANDVRVTRRTIVRFLGAGAAALAMGACGGAAPAAPPAAGGAPTGQREGASGQRFTMKIGTATINDVQHEWCKRYAERLQRRTNGQIAAEVYPASQLGSIPRMIEGVQLGTIEAWMGPPEFAVGLEPRLMVPGMPGLFRDMDEAYRVINDPAVLDHFLALTEPKGIKGVALIIYGPMVVFDRIPIRTPDDMRGRKYRIFAAPTEIETMNAFGATGVPITLGEVPTALSTGTVDGAQSGITVGDTFKLYDLVKYATETHHAMITSFGGVSKTWFERLPPDLQRAVVEEGRALHAELLEFQKAEIAKASQTWNQQTGGGLLQLSEAEREGFRARLANVPEVVLQQKPEIRETLEVFRGKVRQLAG